MVRDGWHLYTYGVEHPDYEGLLVVGWTINNVFEVERVSCTKVGACFTVGVEEDADVSLKDIRNIVHQKHPHLTVTFG